MKRWVLCTLLACACENWDALLCENQGTCQDAGAGGGTSAGGGAAAGGGVAMGGGSALGGGAAIGGGAAMGGGATGGGGADDGGVSDAGTPDAGPGDGDAGAAMAILYPQVFNSLYVPVGTIALARGAHSLRLHVPAQSQTILDDNTAWPWTPLNTLGEAQLVAGTAPGASVSRFWASVDGGTPGFAGWASWEEDNDYGFPMHLGAFPWNGPPARVMSVFDRAPDAGDVAAAFYGQRADGGLQIVTQTLAGSYGTASPNCNLTPLAAASVNGLADGLVVGIAQGGCFNSDGGFITDAGYVAVLVPRWPHDRRPIS